MREYQSGKGKEEEGTFPRALQRIIIMIIVVNIVVIAVFIIIIIIRGE